MIGLSVIARTDSGRTRRFLFMVSPLVVVHGEPLVIARERDGLSVLQPLFHLRAANVVAACHQEHHVVEFAV